MWPDVVVVFEEFCHVVESRIVEFECLPETFYLALRCRFSNGTHDVFYAMGFQVGCELASCILTVELSSMIAHDLSGHSSSAQRRGDSVH